MRFVACHDPLLPDQTTNFNQHLSNTPTPQHPNSATPQLSNTPTQQLSNPANEVSTSLATDSNVVTNPLPLLSTTVRSVLPHSALASTDFPFLDERVDAERFQQTIPECRCTKHYPLSQRKNLSQHTVTPSVYSSFSNSDTGDGAKRRLVRRHR
jgi:hypothetical protein